MSHLRLVPRPLAKIYPTPRHPGVQLSRHGKGWLLEHVRAHRLVELQITTAELHDLVQMGTLLLEMNEGDE